MNSPFGSTSAGAAGGLPATSNSQRMALDNLIRRELRVADPSDPQQVARALMDRYKADPRATSIAREAAGLPFLTIESVPANITAVLGSEGAERKQALQDVDHDLRELLNHSMLKDARAQLEGWGMAIRAAADDGLRSARFALDPGQRDKAFAARRTLAGYARLCRLLGTFTPEARSDCRSLAQSLDEVGAVIIVAMGEALATSGYNGIGALMSVSYSDLQSRRDAVIFALRNLVGSTQHAHGPNEWPRGLEGYREVNRLLGEQGLNDLRVLLNEGELALIMDEMIRRTAESGVEGLRILSGSAEVELDRIRRLLAAVSDQAAQRSPSLTGFLEALQLFLDAFESGTGGRLLRIGRPSLLYYGLYGMGAPNDAELMLDTLIRQRGLLAHEADCLMVCDCGDEVTVCQTFLDKMLYDLDRAIDYFAVGTMNHDVPAAFPADAPELRASAYAYFIDAFIGWVHPHAPLHPLPARCLLTVDQNEMLEEVRNELWTFVPGHPAGMPDAIRELMAQELGQQRGSEERFRNLIISMVPGCVDIGMVFGAVDGILDNAILAVLPGATFTDLTLRIPKHPDFSLESIDDKL